MRTRAYARLALVIVILVAPPSPTPADPSDTQTDLAITARNPRWALRVDRSGLPNLHQVSPTLYRGGQPTGDGFRQLRALGVRTVVSLRAFHGEREKVEQAGLRYERVPFVVWHPNDRDMRRLIALLTDPARQPVFVHCRNGSDRTGTVIAVYRVAVEGWSREEAIDEMVQGGYGFKRLFGHLVRYVRGFRPSSDPSSGAALMALRKAPAPRYASAEQLSEETDSAPALGR